MNTYAQQRRAVEQPKECSVPKAADAASPAISNAINQCSCRKHASRPKIAHGAQSGRVFHLCIACSALGFSAKQPRRRHKTPRLQAMCAELISCRDDATQSFVIRQVVKLSLVLGVEPCQESIAQTFFRTARTFVEVTVDDDFVTVRIQTPEPRHKLPVSCEETLVVIIRHDKKRTDADTAIGQL